MILVEMNSKKGENEEVNRGTSGDETASTPDQSGNGSPDDMAKPQSTKFAAFQFYPRDFLTSSKVARMSLTEIGIYFTLLCYAWLDNGLPCEVDQVARLVRIPAARFKKMWQGPLSECFVKKDAKLVNPRQERQRQELVDYVASCRRGGERSAASRLAKSGSAKPSKALRSALRSETEVTPNTSSASSSSSASSEKNGTSRARPQPIIARRRLDAAWEGARVYVPQRTHQDFVALRGDESLLFEWYEQVADAWADPSKEPGADMIRFWKARYDERWPPTATAKNALPAWVTK
jgi:uncharacterized protein YdaU (DUF1376 family)